MAVYFRILRTRPHPTGRDEEIIEVDDTGAVTREVYRDLEGELLANSIAILSHLNGHFAEFAWNSEHPSIWASPVPTTADDPRWHELNCTAEPVEKASFLSRFRRARPAI